MLRAPSTNRSAQSRIISFGAFDFDARSGELRKHGLRIRLQGQPADVLAMLLEHPGEMVTREDLQKRLWPADTYVDFEHSLNAAMKRLRAALCDSAEAPRFIETLPRRGYRFVAPLRQPAPTPHATICTSKEELPPAQPPRPVWHRSAIGAILILVLSATILALVAVRLRSASVAGPIRSLAVLPLANVSGDPDQDVFVEGMTDALRDQLTEIGSLRVISRTSSLQYRGRGKSVPEIARELNVDAVVDGSVLRDGDRVRINVELIEAASDRYVWSNSYERDPRDVFSLQASVARTIADEIRVTLTPRDRIRNAGVTPSNAAAYAAYSKGRFYSSKRTEEGLTKAIGFFQQAVDNDPGYALAYDGLADSWLPLGWYGYLSPVATFPQAKVAITKALTIDPSLAEAHCSLAFVKLYYDRDWAGAEREFRRAIEINPNYANGHHWYGEFLSLVGRHQEAIAESERAREIDPLSNIISTWVGSRYFYARQYDKAIERYRDAIEMDPAFGPAHLVLGQVYEQKGMLQEAIAEYQKAIALAGGSSIYTAALAHAFGRSGRRSEAAKIIGDLTKAVESRFISRYDLALAHLGLGDTAEVFELLRAAIQERSPRVAFLGVDPRFDQLRGDPRFRTLLVSIGL